MPASIDLNCDLGESTPARPIADEPLFGVVSSANVACGFHAGGDATMRRSVELAIVHGVVLGAHPGYRDAEGFGRRELGTPADELAAELLAQLEALDGVARAAGQRVRYVKAHGALYHRLGVDEVAARAHARAIAAFDPALAVLGAAGGALERAADATGLRFAREAFADRGVRTDGSLVPRGEPGAVLTDPAAAGRRAVELAARVDVDSICFHGDTPGAASIGRAVRDALEAAGFAVRSFATEPVA
ncbi:LamB/YcsF family protein [Agromyces larvae]|uniref:LamB/YcsF family protein n=1 Tax=Agromyces larvae TaxID=2929802 RepID=A0ABY4BU07_9MICO|nr:5-oxoprolinase subunit PxpA [Agromyces larvae]UOE42664.1 LamB/YcsF family protein [Agromyces larvae]